MQSLSLNSPAKVNLTLSVHARRRDGYHCLSSIVVALAFGDHLHISLNKYSKDQFYCSNPEVPSGENNLILKAAAAFRSITGMGNFFDFKLEKHIPMGAGLGGGSSNAAIALNGMNELSGSPLSDSELLKTAAKIGSDCSFFIYMLPANLSGRGEVIDLLPKEQAIKLSGKKIVLFCPPFRVSTAWAYQRLIEANPPCYESVKVHKARIDAFLASGCISELLSNTFETCVGSKYLAIPCLLEKLRANGIPCSMTGSGSCCFALTKSESNVEEIRTLCNEAWGNEVFFVETSIL
ncbi:MAG: 4-(cytidine 5'-diphospho)-2-C-methyl-D-erythritol kinase [Verrucomicrobiota bacterium]|nr:4-(cytidine 5'-diphospho)-2-C-methyl-D-erythritol kinase [Verrucomicrobiota bacterium]